MQILLDAWRFLAGNQSDFWAKTAAHPVIGVGFRPALIALTLLAMPPLLINTQAGILAVSRPSPKRRAPWA